MAAILFWNINKKRLFEEIISLCNEHEVDILILAEAKPDISDTEVLIALNSDRENVYIAPFNPSPRLSFFFRYPAESIGLVADEGGIAIRRISPPIGLDILRSAKNVLLCWFILCQLLLEYFRSSSAKTRSPGFFLAG